ncbi:MAG: bifunctional 23S rRNA (guanine(2069)-N(7))-methyltransferase RlmK/23S rRNA (guanine(2445)-N(2))-methyltransferase RlmL, partial [Gammaproteobacteria bacterium]|nr:bifunctional 23S rRNA (guanine(2069)-N(7))-methyltransferase RlmK/23S rRNA (guanine(2445)-N(2))-methyltransferase RlmL [Gammaproteobacteria bacterium]
PLKENLAAALLYRSGWPGLAKSGAVLLDPMCGSGTLPIEAALMAADIAPGLLREDGDPATRRPDTPIWGFSRWPGHNQRLWAELLEEARERKTTGLAAGVPGIIGSDQDARSVENARTNARRAGVEGLLRFEQGSFESIRPSAASGLLICNPPYGQRIGDGLELPALFTRLGSLLRTHFEGWRAAVLTVDTELGFRIGLRSTARHAFRNGALDCSLLLFDVDRERRIKGDGPRRSPQFLAEADMLGNRLRKNLRRLDGWRKAEGIGCYRVYDADIPELAFAVDVYNGRRPAASAARGGGEGPQLCLLHAQEYAPPASVDERSAQRRREVMQTVLSEVFEVPAGQIVLKSRARQRGSNQYQRRRVQTGDAAALELLVEEHGCRFLVNLSDYLDTGLFLDHRPLRHRLARQAAGKRFLNLFAYTASASVHAARGGARESVSVDLSASYLDWAAHNFRLNGIDSRRHRLVAADCLRWLDEALWRKERFDLILLDPPTFSNSKRMTGVLDVQRDHVGLVERCLALLSDDGVLYFSTNRRRFELDAALAALPGCEDISQSTIARDFSRNRQVHHCWRLRRPGTVAR